LIGAAAAALLTGCLNQDRSVPPAVDERAAQIDPDARPIYTGPSWVPTPTVQPIPPTVAPTVQTRMPPPTPVPAKLCSPIAGRAIWVLEGDPVSVELRCATGMTPEGFTITPQPTGLTITPGGSLSWRPGLDQAANWKFVITELGSGESTQLDVGVVDRYDHPNNAPVVDASKYTHEYGVPVLHLSFSGDLMREIYSPVQLTYLGHTYQGATAKYRGTTSFAYPKRNYTIAFADSDELIDPTLGRRDKLALITPFDDNSYLRPHMSFEVWNRMDPAHIQVKSFPLVVFLNGKYWGLYTASDHVDSDLMKRAGLSKDGNLFFAYHADGNWGLHTIDGTPKWSPHQGFEKRHGLPPEGTTGAFADLDAAVNWVNSASNSDFNAGFATRFNKKDYEDWWILATLILATDSGGKNAFHYHDPRGGVFRYTPWDFNASFGQDWNTKRLSYTARLSFFAYNKLFERMMADPTFAAETRARYKAVLANEIEVSKILAEFDAYHARITESARRDESKWRAAYRTYSGWNTRTDFTTFDQEVAYTRAWISQRWSSLQSNPQ
jgi:hypothetical protein